MKHSHAPLAAGKRSVLGRDLEDPRRFAASTAAAARHEDMHSTKAASLEHFPAEISCTKQVKVLQQAGDLMLLIAKCKENAASSSLQVIKACRS